MYKRQGFFVGGVYYLGMLMHDLYQVLLQSQESWISWVLKAAVMWLFWRKFNLPKSFKSASNVIVIKAPNLFVQSRMQYLCCLFYTKSVLFYTSMCSTIGAANISTLNIYNSIKDIMEEF